MEFWTEVRTVLFVGRFGTVRAAADAMGVHRATVSRHIDTLEERLGVKLFLRHKDGYSPTDNGKVLLGIAEQTDHTFADFVRGLNTDAGDLIGVLKVSAVAKASPVIRAAMKLFCDAHPGARVNFNTATTMPVLERGEADIAVRACRKPQHPDYVVIPYFSFPVALYGHQDYLRTMGAPRANEDLKRYRFAGSISAFGEFDLAFHYGDFVTSENVALESSDPSVIFDGILEGIGLGLAAKEDARAFPELVEVLPRATQLMADVWIITHVDLHRTPLIQAFVACLKAVTPKVHTPPQRLYHVTFSLEANGGSRPLLLAPVETDERAHP